MPARKPAMIWLENVVTGARHEVPEDHSDLKRARYRRVDGANPACPTCGAMPQPAPSDSADSGTDGDTQNAPQD